MKGAFLAASIAVISFACGWAMAKNDCSARAHAFGLLQNVCNQIVESNSRCEDALAACNADTHHE